MSLLIPGAMVLCTLGAIETSEATGDAPYRVLARDFEGEWTGIVGSVDMLLTLRSNGGQRVTVALSIVDGPTIETVAFETAVQDSDDGIIIDKTGVLRLEAQLERTWGSGSGSGRLTLYREGRTTAAPVDLFFRPEPPWTTRTLALYHNGWNETETE